MEEPPHYLVTAAISEHIVGDCALVNVHRGSCTNLPDHPGDEWFTFHLTDYAGRSFTVTLPQWSFALLVAKGMQYLSDDNPEVLADVLDVIAAHSEEL